MRIICDIPDSDWDRRLSLRGGHPLQSALWGRVCDFPQSRLAIQADDGEILWAARIEHRRIAKFIKVGWAPRLQGLEHADGLQTRSCLPELAIRHLAQSRIHLLASSVHEYVREDPAGVDASRGDRDFTICVGLDGADEVFGRFNRQCRNDIRRAERKGVRVCSDSSEANINALLSLCEEVSSAKNVDLGVSPDRVAALLSGSSTPCLQAKLYVAWLGSDPLSAALVFSGRVRWHYFWGGSTRKVQNYCAGQLLQYEIMKQALEAGATEYDMEGIDIAGNPSTYEFKRKFGGSVFSRSRLSKVGVTGLGAAGLRIARLSPWLR
jgi:hypothetical protein